MKLDGIRAAQKDGWGDEVERLTSLIEKDQATIAAQLSRRVFIRVSYVFIHKFPGVHPETNPRMWHELRVVLHNRENALITQAVQNFAREEQSFADRVAKNWTLLGESVEGMPYE